MTNNSAPSYIHAGREPNGPRTICIEEVAFRCQPIAREYADNVTHQLRLEYESINAAARAWKIMPVSHHFLFSKTCSFRPTPNCALLEIRATLHGRRW